MKWTNFIDMLQKIKEPTIVLEKEFDEKSRYEIHILPMGSNYIITVNMDAYPILKLGDGDGIETSGYLSDKLT